MGAYLYGQEATFLAGNRTRAVFLAEEGLEVARNIRDADFTNLVDGTYGLATSSGQWIFSGSNDTTGIFTRSVTINTIDSNRKGLISNVTWQQNLQRSGSVSLYSRLTYWMKQVGSWANAVLVTSLDLSGNQDGIKVQISGNYAYLIRNNSGATNFMIIDLSDSQNPSVVSSMSLNGTPKDLYVSGNYAYVSSNDNSQELQIINISNPVSPSLFGSYNNSGNSDALGIFVSGNYAYLSISGGTFRILNISNPASPSLAGSVTLSGNATGIVVSGNYAYLASSDNTQELQVVNISNPASPSQVGSLDLSGNTDAITIAIYGSVIFLGQGNSLFAVSVSSPSSPSLLSSVNVSGTLNDIALNLADSGTYVFLATSDNNNEFKVVDVSNTSSLTVVGNVNIAGPNTLNGVAYDSVLNLVTTVGNSNTEEFNIIGF